MIEINGVKKTYHMGDTDLTVLRGVSFQIQPGELVAITGPSGSGKSTLMHILGLLDVPSEGSYKLWGREISGYSEDELAKLRSREIGFVFQQFNLLARTTASENVALPLLYASPEEKEIQRHSTRNVELLNQVGLGQRLGHKPSELSGGQQQRVAIARSLMNHPRILLADEPTGNLDTQSGGEILGILKKLNAEGMTIIIVTHEPSVAAQCQRIIRIQDGQIQSDTSTSENRAASHSQQLPAASGESQAKSHSKKIAEYVQDNLTYVLQAWRALQANKVRTFLSTLGILIGVASVIAMLAVGKGARDSIEARLASMGSNLLTLISGPRIVNGVAMERGANANFTTEDAQGIREQIPSAKHVSPNVSGRGQAVYGGKNRNTRVQGVGADYAEMRAATPTSGRFFTEEENKARARLAVIGTTIAREMFSNVSPIGETMKINKVIFQVIGILPEKGTSFGGDQDDVIVMPVNTAMHRVLGKIYVDNIDVEVRSASEIDECSDALRAFIIKAHHLPASQEKSFDIRNMAEIQEALSQTSRTLSLLLASVAAVSLLVGGIGIMNIMLVSVTERTREIGLRKAVGARRADLLLQFLVEALVISLLGGISGICLGSLISLAISQLAGWATSITAGSILLGFVFSAFVGVVFGILPARKASLMNPIAALRFE